MRGTVTVYTDGSCNNKAKEKGGGIGIVLLVNDWVRLISEGPYSEATSARMEILAVIRSIEMIQPNWNIEIYCDNEYVVKTINEWLESWISRGILHSKKNVDLWERYIKARDKIQGDIKLIWVRGHDGNHWNEKVDKLANKGRLGEQVDELVKISTQNI